MTVHSDHVQAAIPRMRSAPEALPSVTRTPLPVPRDASWQRGYVAGAVAVDVIAGVFAIAMGLVGRFGHQWPDGYLYGSLALIPLWLVLVAVCRGYDRRLIGLSGPEIGRVLRAGASLTVAVAVLSYALNAQFARGYVLIAIPSLVLMSVAGRGFQGAALRYERRHGRCLRRTVLVGPAAAVRSTAHRLRRDVGGGVSVVGASVTNGGRVADLHVPVFDGVARLEELLEECGADTVAVLPGSGLTGDHLRRLAWRLEPVSADLLVCPGLTEVAGDRVLVRPTANAAMLQITPARLNGPSRLAKAAFDRTGAALGLLLISPLLLTVAVVIFARDRGPVLFRQRRVGLGGDEFTIFKFRTMVVDAEARKADLVGHNESDGALFKIAEDPRITRAGRWLRRYSIDELPQLINVVRGEMSLVGPRPPLAEEVAQYSPDMRRRLLVKPGLTGLWQVSGRSDLSWTESETLDIRYVENWSLRADLAILARTVRAVMRGSGAY
jgi:exopolysaccharide biosynthesis polyprenyl glycosylphosphotransferase